MKVFSTGKSWKKNGASVRYLTHLAVNQPTWQREFSFNFRYKFLKYTKASVAKKPPNLNQKRNILCNVTALNHFIFKSLFLIWDTLGLPLPFSSWLQWLKRIQLAISVSFVADKQIIKSNNMAGILLWLEVVIPGTSILVFCGSLDYQVECAIENFRN